MTTIILVIVGVLIAALSALFMIFYGGSAFNSSDDKADAARLVGEGVQIQAAFQAYRAQEDRTPGEGTGVDGAALKDLLCNKYLTHIPTGIEGGDQPTYSETECASPTVKSSASSWKIDYNYGIARSVVGNAKNPDGTNGKAYNICQAARKQLTLAGEPKRCDDPAGVANIEPCCIMSSAEL